MLFNKVLVIVIPSNFALSTSSSSLPCTLIGSKVALFLARDSEFFAFLIIELDSVSQGPLGYLISNNLGSTNLALSDNFRCSSVVYKFYIFPDTRAINNQVVYHNYKQPGL